MQNTVLEQARIGALLGHLPGITFAPLAGVIFSAWVLWDSADKTALTVLCLCVLAVSVVRFVVYLLFLRHNSSDRFFGPIWPRFAIATAFISGVTWGSFAIFVLPGIDPGSERFLIILLALVPVAPVAALATYLPCFYAYYIPASAPFVIVLLLEWTREGWTSATLLVILMFATLQFARNFHRNLSETLRLQLREAETAELLRKSLAAKSQFMIDANHDLRQPLQALELSLFADGQTNSSAHQAMAAMKEYLDRLHQYSELDREPQIEAMSFPLRRVQERLIALFSPVAQANGIRLICVPTSAWVHTDERRLDVIARNLVENAIRHSGAGSKVLIGCRRHGKQIALDVIDNGPGIPKAEQTRVFEEFTQLNNPTREREKGIGLG